MTDNNNKKAPKQEKNKYSSTVLLPKTDFPMRAGLQQKEPQTLQFWAVLDIYNAMLAKAEGKPLFVLHDGPPYANGSIHLGHAMDKTIKDIIVKSAYMTGYKTPYVPGWDCHGLPIEHALMKELKLSKKDLTEDFAPVFRAKARAFAGKFIDIQKEGFKRLGVFADWENYYNTMAPHFEGTVIQSFLELFKMGYIYKGKKSVSWCPTCETALADAEIEYKDKISVSLFVKFRLTEPFKGREDVCLAIWTTTPWTLPANKAAAVAKDEKYVLIKNKTDGSYLITAEKLADDFIKNMELDAEKEESFDGAVLEGLKYTHPFTRAQNPVIWTDFVAMDTGTGIVHIAPGHGEDDYYAGLKWGLDIFSPVDHRGVFTKEAGEFEALQVFEANEVVIKRLKELNLLIKTFEISHSYPHCWRCKRPLIFRATEQWFLAVDKDGLREKLCKAAEDVSWRPEGGKERMTSMLQNRPDWCVSRQRLWGTPITVMYCDKCGEVQISDVLFKAITDRALKEGSDFWFTETPDKIVPPGYKCTKCGHDKFRKEKDILDVWFDSGVTWKEVLKDGEFPADVYSEGADQYRGWFQSSLIPSVILKGRAPYKTVLTHGMALDHNGKAMHKSLGNSISPDDIIKKYGAEILRLWVSMTNYMEDVRISDEILGGSVDAYRKLRNTVRYALGNLFDYTPDGKIELEEMDRYMLGKLDALIKDVRAEYGKFEFRRVVRLITDFCILDLSSFMLDASKDRLYTLGANSAKRKSAQKALAEIVKTLLQLIAPVLSFTAEEAWQELRKLPCGKELEDSIFFSRFPQGASVAYDGGLDGKWGKIRKVREEILLALEQVRQKGEIGSSLEAHVIFKTKMAEFANFTPEEEELWKEIAIVSRMSVEYNPQNEDYILEVRHAEGKKCPRCWRWTEDVGSNSKYHELCARCASVLETEGVVINE